MEEENPTNEELGEMTIRIKSIVYQRKITDRVMKREEQLIE